MQNCTRPNRPDLDATKVPTELDIAWAAGIYEGEGCCRLCGKTKRGLMVQVTQKDHELLYWLRDWFGGSIQKQGTQGNCGVWNCCGDRARIFLALIYPRMTVRRKQQIDATNALEYLGAASPVGLTLAQLTNKLEEFYETHRAMVRERVRKAKHEQYLRYRSQPGWRDADISKKANKRSTLTSEEKEKQRQYQHERYLRQKQEKEVKILQMEKTA